PKALEAVCLKALALKRADRYQTAGDLASDLEHWLADEPVSAWREPGAVKARRWLGKHRTLVSTAAAAALGAVGSLAATGGLICQAREKATLLAHQKGELARAELEQRQKAELRLAENYVNQALSSSDKKEYRRGMLLLARALELCPPEAQELQGQIRTSL